MTDEKKPGLLKKTLKWTASTALTLGVVAGAGATVMFGASALAERSDQVPEPQAAALTQVAVTPLYRQQSYIVERRFIGQVEARETVSISFELGGRLSELLVTEGEKIEMGAVLARLDTSLLEAERTRQMARRDAVLSQLEFAQSQLDRASALKADGFASVEVLDNARTSRDALEAQLAEVEAGLESIEINLEKSVLRAPFSGQVGAQFVDNGSTLGAGQSVVTLVDTANAEVRVGLPLDVSEANLVNATVDVAQSAHSATLQSIRPDIDPTTRTRAAIFSVEAENTPVFGQTATLRLPETVQAEGVWVPMDALQEGSGGVWTILVVDGGLVRPSTVEVLHARETDAYVRGTFSDGALMVESGAHRIVPGQAVDIVEKG